MSNLTLDPAVFNASSGCNARVSLANEHQFVASLVCAALIFFGSFLLVLGYRFYKVTAFLSTFIATSVVVMVGGLYGAYYLDEGAPLAVDHLELKIIAITALSLGLLCGCLVCCCMRAAAFIVGVTGGLIFGLRVWYVLTVYSITVSTAQGWVAVAILALCGGACALYLLKPTVMMGSALCGAICLSFGAQVLASLHMKAGTFCTSQFTAGAWFESTVIGVLVALGVGIQCYTGKGDHHSNSHLKTSERAEYQELPAPSRVKASNV